MLWVTHRGIDLSEQASNYLKLRTLPEGFKSKWKDHLPKIVHAYNCTPHEATGYSHFHLLFGRSPRLPIDLIFQTQRSTETKNYKGYVDQWKSAM